jgi:zinc protease
VNLLHSFPHMSPRTLPRALPHLFSLRTVAGAALLLAAGSSLLMAQAPSTPPAPLPLRSASLPPFQEMTLRNGVRMLLVENHRQPSVVFRLVMPAGARYDAAGKSGTAALLATLLTKGAGSRTAEQFAAAIENTGGGLQAVVDSDFLNVFGSVLSDAAPLAFTLLGEAVTRPTLAPAEFALAQAQSLSGLQMSSASPAFLATTTLLAGLYGTHPYAAVPTPATVRAITPDDVRQFHTSHVRPRGALLVVAGDITPAQLRAWAGAAFASWTGAPPASGAAAPAPPSRRRAEIVLVHRPGSVQSNILIGNLALGPADSSRLAAELALQVLGGGSDGRLFKVLREQKSWTYGAYASMSRPLGLGLFQASAEVRTAVTDSAVTEMLAQLARLGREPIPTKELEDTRSGMVGSFPLAIETPGGLAALVAFVKLYGVPADYLQSYRLKLSRVTSAQVTAAARRVVRPDEALIVVVGDAVALYDKLAAIAPVTLRSADGRALQPAELMPKRTPPGPSTREDS